MYVITIILGLVRKNEKVDTFYIYMLDYSFGVYKVKLFTLYRDFWLRQLKYVLIMERRLYYGYNLQRLSSTL